MEQNRTEPGEELASSIMAAEAFPGFHQRILGQIFRHGFITAKRQRLPQQTSFEGPADFSKRFGITRSGLREETARL